MRKKSLVDVVTAERFSWEEKCLGKLAFQSKKACRKMSRSHFSGKNTADFWKQVFKTGMTPDGVSVIAKPLNTIEMTQG